MKILPIILAGGTGRRLWPLSRELHPKQFLPITSELSLLQETVQRTGQISNTLPPIIVGNEEHRFLIAEQLRQISCKPKSILLEPAGRNTAPAVTLAALEATLEGKDPILLILPADHIVKDTKASVDTIQKAAGAAGKNKLVTFGVKPKSAETGYGYIQSDTKFDAISKTVNSFKEKPDSDKAEKYIKEDWLWNSGIFMVKASIYLGLVKDFSVDVLNSCKKALEKASIDFDFKRPDKEEFLKCPSISIDYAILEKTNQAVVVPFDVGWSDLSSWSTLWDVFKKDKNGNVTRGDVTLQETKDSMVLASRRQVCTLGVEDIVVVETDTSILVANKHEVQKVKELTDTLKKAGRPEVELHREVCRPWGKYDSIDKGERFQVKHITVNPGEKLSKQMHYHRAEHWIVVSGTAKVLNGDKEIMLSENESTYIPLGTIHSLENPGNIPLEIIEVQSGSYLGEDDIVRFEDRYGRAEK